MMAAAPNYLMRDRNSPHAFTAAQMGHDTQDPADHAGEARTRPAALTRPT
jgi:hypothetical protein